jgi:hypothetical protein
MAKTWRFGEPLFDSLLIPEFLIIHTQCLLPRFPLPFCSFSTIPISNPNQLNLIYNLPENRAHMDQGLAAHSFCIPLATLFFHISHLHPNSNPETTFFFLFSLNCFLVEQKSLLLFTFSSALPQRIAYRKVPS